MMSKKFVYFVSLSSNVPFALKEALIKVKQNNEVAIFFDLDGAQIFDRRYLNKMDKIHGKELSLLLNSTINAGIKIFGCQMNVLMADGLELINGAELAGVATFLEIAYQADSVLSY
ncbi:DsrE/DsrF/DrsH-like family protein [Neobacillus mesonae]|uniref:DsrE/DsrF/DrsH-like family protein n=2 Tax=Neobacillus mesonae TaxID=1193713 RepID=UPI002572DA68|nr:DsrE/DsrF/DrsH-like family protein [Neobacillus mesonae]